MRLTTVILIMAIMQVSASTYGQRITLSEKNATLRTVFDRISDQSGYNFIFTSDLLKATKPVSINVKNTELKQVLEQIFEDQPVAFSIEDRTVVVKAKTPSLLDLPKLAFNNIDARGKILDEKGSPLEGATIVVKGTNRTTKTDAKGEFVIANVPEDAVLVIRYVGYKELEVSLKDAVMPLEIKLNVATGELEEVSINYSTGYQTLPKERATGSFVHIDKEKLNEQVGTNFLSRLPLIASSVTTLPARVGGQSDRLVIRGLSSITGPRTPLIILDNFPYEGDVNNINPNEIENITILKDAAAASIWGAKAGNGVIVITTKTGKFNEKTRIDFNSNVTITGKPDLFYLKKISSSDLIDAETFLFSKGFYNAVLNSIPVRYQTPVVDILERLRKTQIDTAEANRQLNVFRNIDVRNDLLKYSYQNGLNQQYALNMHGGNDNLAWIISGGIDKNLDELASVYDRYSAKLDQTYKPITKLQINAGVYYTYSKSKTGKTSYGDFNNTNLPAYTRFKDDAGAQIPLLRGYRKAFLDTAGRGLLLDWKYYPMEEYKHNYTTNSVHDLIGKFGLRYSILEGLTADIKYQFERQTTNAKALSDLESYTARDMINKFSQLNYTTKVITYPIPVGGIIDLRDNVLNAQNIRGMLNFDRSFGRNAITAIAGIELRDITTDGKSNRVYGYDDKLLTSVPVVYNVNYTLFNSLLGSSLIQGTNSLTKIVNRYVSTYFNAAYTYNEKYTLSLSARRDASNLFGVASNNKWNPFWSAGALWNISKEKFYKSELVPQLKIRATYGYSGNVSPNMTSVPTIRYSGASIYTNGQIARVSNFKNEDLRWEKVNTLNLAVDFSSKNNILFGSVEYYRKKATDLYGGAPVDRTLGLAVSQVTKNYASLSGNGLDVNLNSRNLNGVVSWTTGLLFSLYKDRVEKFNLLSTGSAVNFVGGNTIGSAGYPRYPLFTYISAGLSPVNGSPQGYLNGKISTNYDALVSDSATLSDLKYHGSAVPVYFGAIGNTISWKGISVTARLSYKLGYSFLRTTIDYTTLFDSRRGHEDYALRWQKPGDEKTTNVPSMTYPLNGNREFFYANSDVLVERADHIRLEYINLSYSLAKNKLKKLPFTSIRFFVTANNLGVLWKATAKDIDPDYDYSVEMPPAKRFSIGFNVNL